LNELRRKISVNIVLELGGRRPNPVNLVLEWLEEGRFSQSGNETGQRRASSSHLALE